MLVNPGLAGRLGGVGGAGLPFAINVTGAQLRDALANPSAWGETLGPELAGTLPTPTITDNTGSVGAWNAGTRTMSNSVTNSNTGFPRYQFELGLVVGKPYRVVGQFSAGGFVGQVRLATGGAANDVPLNFAAGTFSGTVTAAATSLGIHTDGTQLYSLSITSISVREVVTGWLLPGLGGARLSGDCRTSVAMQTAADGTVGYAAHNLCANSLTAVYSGFNGAADGGIVAVAGPAAIPLVAGQVRQITMAGNTSMARFGATSGGTALAPHAGGVWMRCASGSGNFTVDVNDAAGTAFSVDTNWQFVSASTTGVASAYQNVDVLSDNVGTVVIYVCAPRVCLGADATRYVPTGASARYGPAIDWLSGIGSYGIRSESARTNLLTHSTQFDNAAWTKAGNTTTVVTPNTTIAPDSTLTADTITFGGSLGSDRIFQDTATAAANGTAVAGSVWLWAAAPTTVTLFVERSGPADTEFTVCSLTTTPTRFTMLHSTTWTGITNIRLRIAEKAGGGDIYAWGAQLEAGTEASSPILTYGAAATRAADTLVVLDSGWLNTAAGTWGTNFVPRTVAGGARTLVSHDNGSFYAVGSGMLFRLQDSGAVDAGGNSSATPTTPTTVTAGVENRASVGYQAGVTPHFAVSLNGGELRTIDADYTGVGTSRVQIGNGPNGQLNGHLTRIRYSRRRASNAQLQALTV